MLRRLALVAPLLFGCTADEPADLGEDPLDQVILGESALLAHLGASYVHDAAPGEAATPSLLDLLSDEDPALVVAPDPSAILEGQRTWSRDQPPLTDGIDLRVLTYNVNLIDRWYPFTTLRGGEIEARRAAIPGLLLARGWDVIFFQEVFEHIDVDRIETAAAIHGYRIYRGTAKNLELHGLVIAAREELIGGSERYHERLYAQQREIERFPGPGLARGFLAWSFVHRPTGRRIWLVDTHLTAFVDYWRARAFQARELGLYVRDRPESDLVVVGGDFNAAPYYPEDTFGIDGGESIGGWWRNSMMYPVFLHYSGAIDAMAAIGGAADVRAMRALPAFDAATWSAEPYGDQRRCVGLERVFTWDWCNSLAFLNYDGASEYPARIDYIFVRDRRDGVRIVDAGLRYTEAAELGEVEIELSDHHAVGATLRLRSDR